MNQICILKKLFAGMVYGLLGSVQILPLYRFILELSFDYRDGFFPLCLINNMLIKEKTKMNQTTFKIKYSFSHFQL